MAGKLTGYLTRNPAVTIEDLQEIMDEEKKKEDRNQPTERELHVASDYKTDPIFYNWVLYQLVKNRKYKDGREYYEILDMPKDGLFNRNIQEELRYIYDWYRANNVTNIQDYSFDVAVQKEYEWHETLKGRDSGKVYLPTKPENIKYGPDNWENPEFMGWTIQEATEPNDRIVEGEKMDHCVDSYADDTDIRVFSLRNPQNNPHVTIGMEAEANIVFDIGGVGNQQPKPKYKAMIKEWIINLGKVYNNITDIYDLENEFYSAESPEEIDKELGKMVATGKGELRDEYGMILPETSLDWNSIYEHVKNSLANYHNDRNGGWTYHVSGEINSIVNGMINLIIEKTKEEINEMLKLFDYYGPEWIRDDKIMAKAIQKIDREHRKEFKIELFIQNVQEDYQEALSHMDFPPEYSEFNYKEWEEMEEEERDRIYTEYERDWMKHSYPGCLAMEIIDEFFDNEKAVNLYSLIGKIKQNIEGQYITEDQYDSEKIAKLRQMLIDLKQLIGTE